MTLITDTGHTEMKMCFHNNTPAALLHGRREERDNLDYSVQAWDYNASYAPISVLFLFVLVVPEGEGG